MRPSAVACLLLPALIGASCGADTDPYSDAVVNRFSEGDIMDQPQAECVAESVVGLIDWEGASARGIDADELFSDASLLDHLSPTDVDALVEAIDSCRGAEAVVLAIFGTQLELDGDQVGCFVTRMTPESARDLLRLILTGDQTTFAGSEGELVLGACSR